MGFRRLFEPISIGKLELKNRIVFPAISTNFPDADRSVSQRQIDYYCERAGGGVGLIITEAACVESNLGKLSPIQMSIDDDRFLPGLNRLAEQIRLHGAKVAVQLHHAGRRAQWTGDEQPVSASNHLLSPRGILTKALSKEEIYSVVNCFGEAARRAKTADFDAVEIHGGHGYLIANFLSPYANKRTDEYGGNIDGRARFALEIVKKVREKVGDDFPIIFRISADDFYPEGLTLQDAKIICSKLEKASVNIIHVSAGTYESRHWTAAPAAVQPGHLVHLAAEIKKVVKIPVITVGRINDPVLADKILAEGKADLVSMGRALIADPHLPVKSISGELGKVRKCIACNRCQMRFGDMLRIKCTVNPVVGREQESAIVAASEPKKVLVVGGGPSGLEAAYAAAFRGHVVTLYEKDSKLGGQLNLACVPPFKNDIKGFVDYSISRLAEAGVKVQLKTEVTAKLVEKESPDAVIIATGASPIIPRFAEINAPNIITAWDALQGQSPVGNSVVIVGGGQVGCETADYLANAGKSVIVLEMLDTAASDMELRTRILLLERLQVHGVKVFTKTKVKKISSESVIASRDGEDSVFKCDTVIISVGAKSDRKLAVSLQGKVKEIHLVGDCLKPRKLMEAVEEGFFAGIHV